jgi:hypothetical protein
LRRNSCPDRSTSGRRTSGPSVGMTPLESQRRTCLARILWWRSGGEAGYGGVQDFADRAARGGGAIGLLEIAGRRKLHAGRPCGITAGEQNGKVGKASQEACRGSGATHAEHDDAEDGESGGLRFAKAEGLLAVGSSQDAVAEADEGLTNHFADGVVVFGDEDGLAAVKIEGRRGLREPRAEREASVAGR